MKTLLVAALAASSLDSTAHAQDTANVDHFAVPYAALALSEFLCGLPSPDVDAAMQSVLQLAIEYGHSPSAVLDASTPAIDRLGLSRRR
jgi:hypothetical protein